MWKKDKLIFNVIYAMVWGLSLNNIKQIGGIEIKFGGNIPFSDFCDLKNVLSI